MIHYHVLSASTCHLPHFRSTYNVIMAEEPSASVFFVGKTFNTYTDFLNLFDDFCVKLYEPLVITTNNKKQVIVQCRHGYTRKSTSTGKRSKLHYNYIGCTARITCYKPASKTCVNVTAVNLQHNHEISKAAFEL